jgi:hypothetical protein
VGWRGDGGDEGVGDDDDGDDDPDEVERDGDDDGDNLPSLGRNLSGRFLPAEELFSLGVFRPAEAVVTSQDFIKFWGKFFAFVLLVMIENS